MTVTFASFLGFLTAPIAALLALRLLDDDGLSRPDRCPRCGKRFSIVALLSGSSRFTGAKSETDSEVPTTAGSPSAGWCHCGNAPPRWIPPYSVMVALLFGSFAWAVLHNNCQHVDEVQPSDVMRAWRLAYHLVLIWLLVVITITDLIDYSVDLRVALTGLGIGLGGAVLSGQFQLIHIWVNWDDILVSIRGAYLPPWMDSHRHLHGLAWSVAGAACGASITWTVRWLSQLILRQPALGLGDVYIMAMVGSFIGWQPALCALAISPLAGLVTFPVCRFVLQRNFVAFGPYLAVSTIAVLFSWRYLWQVSELRMIFSHWPTVVALVGGSLLLLAVLLTALRIWKSIGRPSN